METIKQRIQKKRGEYEKKRRKIYLHFKHIGRLDLYYKQKNPKLTKPVKSLKLSWRKRFVNFIKNLILKIKKYLNIWQ